MCEELVPVQDNFSRDFGSRDSIDLKEINLGQTVLF